MIAQLAWRKQGKRTTLWHLLDTDAPSTGVTYPRVLVTLCGLEVPADPGLRRPGLRGEACRNCATSRFWLAHDRPTQPVPEAERSTEPYLDPTDFILSRPDWAILVGTPAWRVIHRS